MDRAALSTRLHDLASRARRLTPPLNHKPEAFHEARSELARDLDILAESLTTRTTGDKPTVLCNAPGCAGRGFDPGNGLAKLVPISDCRCRQRAAR